MPIPVRYSDTARADIGDIFRYISRDNPAAAAAVVAAIYQAVELLGLFPEKSRRTRRHGLRALPLSRYPYIIFFKIQRGELYVVHILHGARRHLGFQEEAAAFTPA